MDANAAIQPVTGPHNLGANVLPLEEEVCRPGRGGTATAALGRPYSWHKSAEQNWQAPPSYAPIP